MVIKNLKIWEVNGSFGGFGKNLRVVVKSGWPNVELGGGKVFEGGGEEGWLLGLGLESSERREKPRIRF